MVRLRVTDLLSQKLHKLLDPKDGFGNEIPLDLSELIQEHVDRGGQWIAHSTLAKIGRWNASREALEPEYTLRALVRGSELYLEPPVVKERSPQLEAILAPIRIAQEQASYASMMASASSDPGPRNLDPFGDTTSRWDFTTASHPELTVKQEWDLARKELGAIFNVLASMAAVATAVYWITGSHQPAKRVLLALFGAIGIGTVEGLLYALLSRSRSTKPPKALSR